MSPTKTLTISVAAFNMENYLRTALDSLCSPNVLERLEVFVIDDGSTDTTYSIAQEYALAYPGSFHAVSKGNEGYGSTINWSLAHASGKYFLPLDADDWLDTDGLHTLLDLLDDSDADIVVTPFWEGTQEGQMTLRNAHCQSRNLVSLSGQTIKPQLFIHELTFKTSLLQQCLPELPHKKLYTDTYLYVVPTSVAKTVQFEPVAVYCLRRCRPGQSTSAVVQAEHLDDLLYICEDLAQFCNKQCDGENYQIVVGQMSAFYLYTISALLKHLPCCSETLELITKLERQTAQTSKDVFDDAARYTSKAALFLRLMRKSGYRSYWLLKLLPQRAK